MSKNNLQNAEQRKSGRFPYTNYDTLGRVIESGETGIKNPPIPDGDPDVRIGMEFSQVFGKTEMMASLERAGNNSLPNFRTGSELKKFDWTLSRYNLPGEGFHTEGRSMIIL